MSWEGLVVAAWFVMFVAITWPGNARKQRWRNEGRRAGVIQREPRPYDWTKEEAS